MGVGQISIAAATAVLGYDLFQNTIFQQQGKNRALTGVALKGSTAAADTKVDLFIDTVKLGEFYNTGTAFPNMDDVIPLDGNFVPAGTQLHMYVTDAPATNPINAIVTWKDV